MVMLVERQQEIGTLGMGYMCYMFVKNLFVTSVQSQNRGLLHEHCIYAPESDPYVDMCIHCGDMFCRALCFLKNKNGASAEEGE